MLSVPGTVTLHPELGMTLRQALDADGLVVEPRDHMTVADLKAHFATITAYVAKQSMRAQRRCPRLTTSIVMIDAAQLRAVFAPAIGLIALKAIDRNLAMRATGRPPGRRGDRWSWLHIDTSEHTEGIDRFVWTDDPVRVGERRIVAVVVVASIGLAVVLPALRDALA